jgi:hypothetical protein
MDVGYIHFFTAPRVEVVCNAQPQKVTRFGLVIYAQFRVRRLNHLFVHWICAFNNHGNEARIQLGYKDLQRIIYTTINPDS